MESQNTEKKTSNKKKLWLFALPILGVALVAAAVLIANLDVTVTVSEAISTAQTELAVGPLPGGVTCETLSITNDATWDLWASLSFAETTNPNSVIYTTNLPSVATLIPGSNNVDVCFNVTSDSPIGTITGTVTIDRVAQP